MTMMANNALRGRVIEKFGSIQRFAEALNWSYSKTSRIVNHTQEPTGQEIGDMADALDVTVPGDIRRIFLFKSTQIVNE